MVHRGQALLLLVAGGLAAAVVGTVAVSGAALPTAVAIGASSMVVAPESGLPAKIAIGAPSHSTTGSSGRTGPAAGGPPGSATVVPSNVYAHPPNDNSQDCSPDSSPGEC